MRLMQDEILKKIAQELTQSLRDFGVGVLGSVLNEA